MTVQKSMPKNRTFPEVCESCFYQENSENSKKRNKNCRAKKKRIFFKKEACMSDLQKYKNKRMMEDPGFWKDYDKRFETFKLGVLLKQARMDAGMTQEQIALELQTTKSVISRMENHATDIRLSTLEKFAKAVGRHIHVALV
jgi:ribosome-binding protein aMBF1 (putative translation factor)